MIGYEPQDDSDVAYADEIRELMLEPARETIVQGDSRGGKRRRYQCEIGRSCIV